MISKKLLPILFILSFSFLHAQPNKVNVAKTPTFDLLSGIYNEKDDKWRTFSDKDLADLHFYSKNYYQRIGLLDEPIEQHIPKVIHFIWVGPRPFPDESIINIESWQSLHPDWVIKFWTDSKERQPPVTGMEKHLINEIPFIRLKDYLTRTQNYAERADLIRYELLYNEGGVYVDHDVFCMRSFDKFATFDFFATLENPHRNKGSAAKIFPCNCLIGAKPHHPIIRQAIREVCERWVRIGKKYPESNPKNTFARVINRTFRAFTLAVQKNLGAKENRDIIFPSSYFFPDKIFVQKTKEKLFAKGFVYATHAFASTWRNSKLKKETTNSKSSSE